MLEFHLESQEDNLEHIHHLFSSLIFRAKFLFVSINFVSAVQIYNSHGKTDSKVLLYDPTIRYFHSEHIPYVILAITILVVFILVPPLFLLLYPTKAFRKCLKIRWDIVSHIMDIFQEWYKDGTEGTRDYRFISGFYFLLRIGLVCQLVVMLLMAYSNRIYGSGEHQFLGFHIFCLEFSSLL